MCRTFLEVFAVNQSVEGRRQIMRMEQYWMVCAHRSHLWGILTPYYVVTPDMQIIDGVIVF